MADHGQTAKDLGDERLAKRRIPACTDLISKHWVEEACVAVLATPFFAPWNVTTAGGCLASQHLASWLIVRLAGIEAARSALHYVAPVGEKD